MSLATIEATLGQVDGSLWAKCSKGFFPVISTTLPDGRVVQAIDEFGKVYELIVTGDFPPTSSQSFYSEVTFSEKELQRFPSLLRPKYFGNWIHVYLNYNFHEQKITYRYLNKDKTRIFKYISARISPKNEAVIIVTVLKNHQDERSTTQLYFRCIQELENRLLHASSTAVRSEVPLVAHPPIFYKPSNHTPHIENHTSELLSNAQSCPNSHVEHIQSQPKLLEKSHGDIPRYAPPTSTDPMYASSSVIMEN